ncbi:hypothetical protein ACHAXS_012862 [Conticribra weissflogii]
MKNHSRDSHTPDGTTVAYESSPSPLHQQYELHPAHQLPQQQQQQQQPGSEHDFPIIIDEKHSCDETASSIDDELSPRGPVRRPPFSPTNANDNGSQNHFPIDHFHHNNSFSSATSAALPPLHPKTPTTTTSKTLEIGSSSQPPQHNAQLSQVQFLHQLQQHPSLQTSFCSTSSHRDNLLFDEGLQNSFRRGRTGSTDTLQSACSSVVSIDAGKHGFIVHDDASSTGSLVFGFPPPPHSSSSQILGGGHAPSGGANRGGTAIPSNDNEQNILLPYQIRSKLNMAPYTEETSRSTDSQSNPHPLAAAWSDDSMQPPVIPSTSPGSLVGYGSITGLSVGYDGSGNLHVPGHNHQNNNSHGTLFGIHDRNSAASFAPMPHAPGTDYDRSGSLCYSNHGSSEAGSLRGSLRSYTSSPMPPIVPLQLPQGYPGHLTQQQMQQLQLHQQQQQQLMMITSRQLSYQSTSDESPIYEHEDEDDEDDREENGRFRSDRKKQRSESGDAVSVYVSMSVILVIFVGMIYGLFLMMKMMP